MYMEQKALYMLQAPMESLIQAFKKDNIFLSGLFQVARNMLSEYETVPVDFNRGPRSYLDMFLMSQCRHHIIANSTFSWWGAWLDPHDDKTVIAPKRWVNGKEMPDICPENWIRIET